MLYTSSLIKLFTASFPTFFSSLLYFTFFKTLLDRFFLHFFMNSICFCLSFSDIFWYLLFWCSFFLLYVFLRHILVLIFFIFMPVFFHAFLSCILFRHILFCIFSIFFHVFFLFFALSSSEMFWYLFLLHFMYSFIFP